MSQSAAKIEITIPGEPVAKGRPRMTRNGIAYTPQKTQRWEQEAQWEARAQYQGKPLDGCLIVTIHAYFAIPESWPKWKREQGELENVWHIGKPDADNVAKCVDAFNGVLWVDDARIASLGVCKRYSQRPRVEITVLRICALHTKSKKTDMEAE